MAAVEVAWARKPAAAVAEKVEEEALPAAAAAPLPAAVAAKVMAAVVAAALAASPRVAGGRPCPEAVAVVYAGGRC